jgi:hypothetical protein
MANEKKGVSIISKMSVKGLGCNPKKVDDTNTPLALCQIFGKADGIKVGEGRDGRVWQCLTGNFAGINLVNGEEYRSGKLFLPAGIQEVVENAVKSLGEGSDVTVRFGLQISAVVASNPIGYSYQARNLMPMATGDELSDLRRAIESGEPVPEKKAAEPEKKTEPVTEMPKAKTGNKK